MIAYPDFEFAITRWKARAAGIPQPAPPATSGAVEAPMPVSTAPEDAGDYAEEPRYEAEVDASSGSVVASEADAGPNAEPDEN